MTNKNKTYKFILSGGGTGGHIFPALAIANAIKNVFPDAEILFVGAKGRMEMEKVPAAGYKIIPLWISGLNRAKLWKNFSFPFKLISSLWNASKIIKKFKPDAVIGTGGYASGAVLYMAQKKGIPTFIQEQNSYPGITNKLLAKKAKKIYVAYDNLGDFFDKSKIVNTGNPIRKELYQNKVLKQKALEKFGLSENKKTLFIVGGSLGAMPVNTAIEKNLDKIKQQGWQLIWQTGKNHFEKFKHLQDDDVKIMAFIQNMNEAYSASDVIISRAGAGSISELAIIGKPVILVPSPYVAEDHQTKNAQALASENAAILIKENQLDDVLLKKLDKLNSDEKMYNLYSNNIKKFAKPDATENIVKDILKYIDNK